MKIMKIIVITMIILISFITYTYAATGTVTTDGVRFRKEESLTGGVITYLYPSDTFEVLEKVGEWYKIQYEGTTGYAHADFVKIKSGEVVSTPVEEPEEEPEQEVEQTPEENLVGKMKKTAGDVRVYVIPSISSTVAETLPKNKECTVLDDLNGWVKVQYEGGKTGWVRTSKLSD